jgi:hypothetical protein
MNTTDHANGGSEAHHRRESAPAHMRRADSLHDPERQRAGSAQAARNGVIGGPSVAEDSPQVAGKL